MVIAMQVGGYDLTGRGQGEKGGVGGDQQTFEGLHKVEEDKNNSVQIF